MRSGWSSGSIFWVPLVSGWISLSKTIIPEAQEHFLTPSARRHTHLFGGLRLTLILNQSQGGIYVCGAITIGLDATVKLFRLHLEDDPVPSTDFMHMHIPPWY